MQRFRPLQTFLLDVFSTKTKTKLRGFGPRANYTDRATEVCWRS
jgi:hypothetical protein